MTYFEVVTELLISRILTVRQGIALRIEFKALILNNITKN